MGEKPRLEGRAPTPRHKLMFKEVKTSTGHSIVGKGVLFPRCPLYGGVHQSENISTNCRRLIPSIARRKKGDCTLWHGKEKKGPKKGKNKREILFIRCTHISEKRGGQIYMSSPGKEVSLGGPAVGGKDVREGKKGKRLDRG